MLSAQYSLPTHVKNAICECKQYFKKENLVVGDISTASRVYLTSTKISIIALEKWKEQIVLNVKKLDFPKQINFERDISW